MLALIEDEVIESVVHFKGNRIAHRLCDTEAEIVGPTRGPGRRLMILQTLKFKVTAHVSLKSANDCDAHRIFPTGDAFPGNFVNCRSGFESQDRNRLAVSETVRTRLECPVVGPR
jgi:hypothetical protein